MSYNWQQPDWPDFRYDLQHIEDQLFAFASETGQISGALQAMSGKVQAEALVHTMVMEAIKTSAIEGAYLSRQDVASSIRNNLGLNEQPHIVKDRSADGIGELIVDVRNTFAGPLSSEQLLEWHRMLLGASRNINTGTWRTHEEPMQIVSGALGKEHIHFEAPPSRMVAAEMDRFIRWFNDTAPGGPAEIKKAPVRSAIAHLYFESIHPFEDGNGRIGRAIAEKALSQTIGRPVMLSLSRAIESDRKAYYQALGNAQRNNDVNGWVSYFVQVILQAQQQTGQLIDFTLKKVRFFDRFRGQLNERQEKVIGRMLAEGPDGFEGGMNAKKYGSIAGTSKATATRDLQELLALGVLAVSGGGRSTHYHVVL